MGKKITVNFELLYKEAVKNLDEFQKEYAKLEKEVVEANEKTAQSIAKVEKSAEQGAKGVQKVGVSLKNLGKATGILFLLQQAFEFVKGAVSENQAVMDALNVVMDTAQIVFNQVLNAVTDVYKAVSESTENFDALGKVLSGILTLTLLPFKLTFYGIKLGIQEAMLAWENSFFGDKDQETIKELSASILETKESIVEVMDAAEKAGDDIVNNFGEAMTELGDIGEVIKKEFSEVDVALASQTAKTNLQLKKSAQIALAQSRIIFESRQQEAEQLRQIRDDERLSIEDRTVANEKLSQVLELQQAEMLKQTDLVLANAQAQFNLTGKTTDYVAVLDAQAEKAAVLNTIEGQRSEQKANDLALTKEQIELENAKGEAGNRLLINQKRFDAEQMESELARLEQMQLIDEVETAIEQKRLQAIVDKATIGTQAQIDAQIALDEFMQAAGQQSVARDKEVTDAKIKIAQAERDAKMKAVADIGASLMAFSNLAGEETAAGKALAIASATISTFTGIASIWGNPSDIGPTPLQIAAKIAGTAAVAAGGFGAVKKIVSTKVPVSTGGGGGGGGGAAPTYTPVSQPPAFNIAGASETNQLAEAIGETERKPQRSYVVSSDVTTAQELDRNIVDGASIG